MTSNKKYSPIITTKEYTQRKIKGLEYIRSIPTTTEQIREIEAELNSIKALKITDPVKKAEQRDWIKTINSEKKKILLTKKNQNKALQNLNNLFDENKHLKPELKVLKQKLKEINDIINHQTFLYGTERKRKVRIKLLQKIETLEQRKQKLELKINEHPIKVEAKEKREKKRDEKERIRKEKTVAKIQRWYKKEYTQKIKYSINIMVFRSEDITIIDDEELNKQLETYRKMRIKFFFKDIFLN